MSGHRLDDEKLETLRGWGAGLAGDGRDELRAAGKAILILVEEIDRLQVDLWRHRDGDAAAGDRKPSAPAETFEDERSAEEPEGGLDSTLRGRVGRLIGPRPAKRS